MRVDLVQSGRSALVVATYYTRSCIYQDIHGDNVYKKQSSCYSVPKMNVFGKKLACHEWEPIKSILAQAKSARYKNLQNRKKSSNKQELERTQNTELL